MRSPYTGLPASSFWRAGVANQNPQAIKELYRPKFPIEPSTKIATAGSCFAQHITRYMRTNGYSVVDVEPAPAGLDEKSAIEFGFSLYSARYGNIYTSRQLLQLFREAEGEFRPADAVWEKGSRYFDAIRPSAEPRGLSSAEQVRDARAFHLRQLPLVLETADVFIFTLGLTESWFHRPTGTVYPLAPGVMAGQYDPAIHQFHNLTFHEVYSDLAGFFTLAEKRNPRLRFLLTVSPVPLAATATGHHVLAATTYSKSVLRAAAGQLAEERENVDYFPSFEIIASALSRGAFYSEDLRNVTTDGVRAVMNAFFVAHGAAPYTQTDGVCGDIPGASLAGRAAGLQIELGPPDSDRQAAPPESADEDDVVCEEILLDAAAS